MPRRAELLKSRTAPFITTNWKVILQAGGQTSGEAAQAALADLYRAYWPPVYSFIRRRGYGRAETEDLIQDFFVYLIQHEAFAKAKPSKGRFRSFLLAWLINFLGTREVHGGRIKRGGDQKPVFLDASAEAAGEFGLEELMVGAPLDEERLFDCTWAVALVTRAMEILAQEHAKEPKARVFAELKPFLQGGAEVPSQEEAAARLGMPVETFRSHLSRLRARYRAILREQVMHTVAESSDVDEELRYLCRVLISAHP